MQATGGAKCTDSGLVLEASFPRVAVELPLPRGLGFSFPGTWHPTVPTGILARCIRAVGHGRGCARIAAHSSRLFIGGGGAPIKVLAWGSVPANPLFIGVGVGEGELALSGGETTSRDTGDSISCEIIQDEKQFRPFRRPVRSIATISCILLASVRTFLHANGIQRVCISLVSQ